MARSRTQQRLLQGFGDLLKELHSDYEAKKGAVMSHDALARIIVQRIEQMDGPALSFAGSTLWRWEEGQVGNPDLLALRELASIYDVNFYGLLDVVITNRWRTSLNAKEARQILEGNRARVPAAASDRIQQLESQLSDQKALLGEVQAVARTLFKIVFTHGDGRTPGTRTPGRGSRDRAAS